MKCKKYEHENIGKKDKSKTEPWQFDVPELLERFTHKGMGLEYSNIQIYNVYENKSKKLWHNCYKKNM